MADLADSAKPSNDRLYFSLGYKFISLLLLVVIAIMLLAWKPWTPEIRSNDRTINVTGEATLKAEPDQFTFNPSYSFKSADKAAALKQMTTKSDEVVNKLKSLGVEDRNIKTNASGYDYERYYIYDSASGQSTYQLSLGVVVGNRDKAQKVQDYLVSTNPTGSVSPTPSFSDSKRKNLEKQARDNATREARAKADQSAKNLGFKVGAVKSVQDGSGFGGIYPTSKNMALDTAAGTPQLAVQPGENDFNYSVTVVYYLR